MAHVRMVFLKCGALHNNFVWDQISPISIFISLGFRMLNARTDLLVRRDIVLMLSRSLRLLIWNFDGKLFTSFSFNHIFSGIPTGYSDFPFPVFSWYINFRISNASSVSPHSMRNFGLSGKKNNQQPSNKLKKRCLVDLIADWVKVSVRNAHLGMAQIATKRFQLWNRNQPCLISTSSGIISQAIPGKEKSDNNQ